LSNAFGKSLCRLDFQLTETFSAQEVKGTVLLRSLPYNTKPNIFQKTLSLWFVDSFKITVIIGVQYFRYLIDIYLNTYWIRKIQDRKKNLFKVGNELILPDWPSSPEHKKRGVPK